MKFILMYVLIIVCAAGLFIYSANVSKGYIEKGVDVSMFSNSAIWR